MVTSLPPVSIGMPFFNAERFLLDAIRSVFAQTHEDWELILMDDGSSDRSLEIARSIDDPRVRVYSDGENKKLAARLNEINRLAKHGFIARMDADDLMATDRIEKQLRLLMARPEVDLVTSGVCSISDDSVPYGMRLPQENHVLTPYRVLSGGHGIVHAAIVGRADWFRRNPYDPSDYWAEDYKLWVRSVLNRDLSVAYIREPLYFYREEGSATTKKMLSGQRISRGVVRNNGIQLIGPVGTAYLLGRSYLKSIVTTFLDRFGGAQYVIRARSPHVETEGLGNVLKQIQKIRMTSLYSHAAMSVDVHGSV